MDKMNIEILEDGTISISTDKISAENHVSADELLDQIETLMGGKRETTKTKIGHVHTEQGKTIWHKH